MKSFKKKSISDNRSTRPGPPATGITPLVGVRMTEEFQDQIRAWAKRQNYNPSLAAAIRRLVEIGLAHGKMPRSLKGTGTVAYATLPRITPGTERQFGPAHQCGTGNSVEIVTTIERKRSGLMLSPSLDLPDDTLLQDVNLPVRVQNALASGGLRTVGEVRKTSSSDLLTFQNVGLRTISVIRELFGPQSA